MGLIARAKHILLAPNDAWQEIEREPPAPASLLLNYALPLAAIGPAALAVRTLLFETPAPPVSGLALIAAGTALNLAAALSVAIATMFVAAVCGAKREFGRALTVSFYSATSMWIASVSVLAPDQAVFAIVVFGGLMHSLYLFYLGLIAVLKVPDDDAGIATAIIITLALAAFVALGWVFAFVV
ncbi:MAG TPA: Yip1 family protein [Burkholderiales bacterium]|nr:Yip1 family protein [Burkholderiales bacterium]